MTVGSAPAVYADLAVSMKKGSSNSLRHIDRENSNRKLNIRLEAQRRERNRIARELHDTCFQSFASALFLLDNATEHMRPDSPAKPSVNRAVRILREALEEGRATLQGLRSSAPAPTSLEYALAALRDEYVLDSNVGLRIFVVGQPRELQPAIQKQIYLIGREAIINALRHSQATKVETEIQYLRRHIRLGIRDNGCGIDPKILRAGRGLHWGLLGMRERAETLGANLRIWSKPGMGTEVEISVRAWPVRERRRPAGSDA